MTQLSEWHIRKRERTRHYLDNIHGWVDAECGACSGSGYYDHNGSPACGACDGTGRERVRGPKNHKYIPERGAHRLKNLI